MGDLLDVKNAEDRYRGAPCPRPATSAGARSVATATLASRSSVSVAAGRNDAFATATKMSRRDEDDVRAGEHIECSERAEVIHWRSVVASCGGLRY